MDRAISNFKMGDVSLAIDLSYCLDIYRNETINKKEADPHPKDAKNEAYDRISSSNLN